MNAKTVVTPDASALKELIREVPDFPKPGINFYDITTLLKDRSGLRGVVDCCASIIERRTWISCWASKHADSFSRPCWPMRSTRVSCQYASPGSCRAPCERVEYALEYGTDILEIHRDAIAPGQNVLVIDDVLATGGTAAAVVKLVEKLKGNVAGLGFVLELGFLNGRDKLNGDDVYSLIEY